jgi:hypothetical protein
MKAMGCSPKSLKEDFMTFTPKIPIDPNSSGANQPFPKDRLHETRQCVLLSSGVWNVLQPPPFFVRVLNRPFNHLWAILSK